MSDTLENVNQFLTAINPAYKVKQAKVPKEPKASSGEHTASTYDGPRLLPQVVKCACDEVPDEQWDDYDTWLNLGMALHDYHEGSEDGFEQFDTHSQRSGKYDADVTREKWESFGGSGITIGTLLHLAREHGNFDLREENGKALLDMLEAIPIDDVGRKADELCRLIAEHKPSNIDRARCIELINSRSDIGKTTLKQTIKEHEAKFEVKAAGPDFEAYPDLTPFLEPRTDSINNHRVWCRNNKIAVSFNGFEDEMYINGATRFDDKQIAIIRREQHRTGFITSKPQVDDNLSAIGYEREFHPVRDYLLEQEKKWDKQERAEEWLIRYCHVKDTKGIRCASKLFLLGAVARIFEPGTKFDYILTLIGPEGLGKSELCRSLAVYPAWLLEGFKLSWSAKEILEQTAGKWICEYGEMSGHGLKEQAALKDAASRRSDSARLAYGRKRTERPRQYVTVANTNDPAPLIHRYGNRRFWCMEVTKAIDLAGFTAIRDQLWGEAVHIYRAHVKAVGGAVVLPPEHWEELGRHQEARRRRSPLEERVEALMMPFVGGIVRATDLYEACGIRPDGRTGVTQDVENAMKAVGWEKARKRFQGGLNAQAVFVKGTAKPSIGVDAMVLSGKLPRLFSLPSLGEDFDDDDEADPDYAHLLG